MRLIQSLLAICLMLLPVLANAASAPQYIRLTLESTEIYAGDVVVLNVEYTGLLDPVDFSPLQSIGKVHRETTGTKIAVVRGKVVEIKLHRIELIPNNMGVVIIGPLNAVDISSNSVSVKVLEPIDTQWQPSDSDVRALVKLSTTTPYLQQQVFVDIALLHRFPIASEQFELPNFDGFTVVQRYAARRPATLQSDGWRSITWRYLLFPTQSGPQTIPAFQASGTMIKSRRERGEFSVGSSPITLDVQPAASDGWWLPARDLTITEAWSKDKRTLAAGDETIRTLIVTAKGVRAEQIPDLIMPDTRGLKITALPVRRDTSWTDNGASARAQFDFRVRAMSPIPVFPDTIRLNWWDLAENRARTSIVPAQRIQIGMPDRQALLTAFGEQQTWGEWAAQWLPAGRGLRPWLVPAAGLFFLTSLLVAARQWLTPHLRQARQRRRLQSRVRRAIAAGRYQQAVRLMRRGSAWFGLSTIGQGLLKWCESAALGQSTGPRPDGPSGPLSGARPDLFIPR